MKAKAKKPSAEGAPPPAPKGPVQLRSLEDLAADPSNPRKIDAQAFAGLGFSLQEFGDISGIVWNTRTGQLVAGHQRLEALRAKHGKRLTLLLNPPVLEAPGGIRFAVRVVDWDPKKQRAANLAANNPEIAGEFTEAADVQIRELLEEDAALVRSLRLDQLLEEGEEAKPKADPDEAPPLPKEAITKTGDIVTLGAHRVMCGSATNPAHVAALLDGHKPQLLLSDPPYCSGGFQEAGRAAGTFGDIAADNLSTRGFQALITATLGNVRPQASYLFTDWRMWTALWDLAEAQGLAVRQMLVWAKETPGLGGLWRTQHELIQFATRGTNKRQKGEAASGNVLHAKRTGNVNHYTEKPVELLTQILENDAKCERGKCPVVDPFLGSGSTLIAAEQVGRQCLGMEVEPKFVDVTVARWEAITGKKAKRSHGG